MNAFKYRNSYSKDTMLRQDKHFYPGFQATEGTVSNLAYYLMPLSFVAATIAMVLVISLMICSAER
jgi:hypothetical protein